MIHLTHNPSDEEILRFVEAIRRRAILQLVK
jgi:hypothetical protein